MAAATEDQMASTDQYPRLAEELDWLNEAERLVFKALGVTYLDSEHLAWPMVAALDYARDGAFAKEVAYILADRFCATDEQLGRKVTVLIDSARWEDALKFLAERP